MWDGEKSSGMLVLLCGKARKGFRNKGGVWKVGIYVTWPLVGEGGAQ